MKTKKIPKNVAYIKVGKLDKSILKSLNEIKKQKNNIKEVVDKMDAEIMEWVYEVIKINFGVDMVQDSTELREIIRNNLISHK